MKDIVTTFPSIPGLSYIDNYISEEHEEDLVTTINSLGGGWAYYDKDISGGRWIKWFGTFEGRYGECSPVPAALINTLMEVGKTANFEFKSVVANRYDRTGTTASHIDGGEGKVVAVLNLLEESVTTFKSPEGVETEITLSPRSLLMIEDDARFVFEHAVKQQAYKEFRYSLIWRL